MNLQDILSKLPFGKKEEEKEYFFALNIGAKNLTAALWMLSGKNLQIINSASSVYSDLDNITEKTDVLLDTVLASMQHEPKKILFGVPDSWLSEDDLKEEYLKLLRSLVKELELSPMAYVATSHALIHYLENKEGMPPTAILVGFNKDDLVVTVSRAGKLDGSKTIKRSDNPGLDIEKVLLSFTSIETLPSKILIYGNYDQKIGRLKSELLSFAWMSKLSFLHFPKIDILEDLDINKFFPVEITSICLAGATEVREDTVLITQPMVAKSVTKHIPEEVESEEQNQEDKDLGFVVGDVSKINQEVSIEKKADEESVEDRSQPPEQSLESEDFAEEKLVSKKPKFVLKINSFINYLKGLRSKVNFRNTPFLIGGGIFIAIILSLLLLPKAHVKIFIEPQILEKDAEVTADPKVKEVNEDGKIIPGQIVETEVTGTGSGDATGKKEIGDPAKGTVVVYNKTFESKSVSKGTILTSPNGLKFSLDLSINIASSSASDSAITFGKSNAALTAQAVGPDGNLPSGIDLTIANASSSQIVAKVEGNFSGGTSKQTTVVSDDDQQRLLASVAGDLRRQAQQKLQDSLKDKKILEEALSEEISKKSFSKNINDQASDFSLNLTVKYKGTAFEDKDLKLIVSKLVNTQVPEGFELNLQETETQADVSKLESDGKLIFLARFRAKMLPKLDLEKIKDEIKGKTPQGVNETLKKHQHILGSEVTMIPSLPSFLQRMPLLKRNITLEVGLK